MMTKSYAFTFPAKSEPAWAAKVDRWYQLDAYAYGLAQAYDEWNREGELGARPAFIVLASPGASNETDCAFARTGATSPSKFVHTLPNVRASSLCQVMEWHGPMLCLQRDPTTIETAIDEASRLLGEQFPVVWVLSVLHSGGDCYETRLHVLKLNPGVAH